MDDDYDESGKSDYETDSSSDNDNDGDDDDERCVSEEKDENEETSSLIRDSIQKLKEIDTTGIFKDMNTLLSEIETITLCRFFALTIIKMFRALVDDLDATISCCRCVRNVCARSNTIRNEILKHEEIQSYIVSTLRHSIVKKNELFMLVAIQTLGNLMTTSSSRKYVWKEMFCPCAATENKILFCQLCSEIEWTNSKALVRLAMILFLCVRDEKTHMQSFVQDHRLVSTWLHTFRSDNKEKPLDMVEWVLLTVQEMISSNKSFISQIISVLTCPSSSNELLALFLHLLVVALNEEEEEEEREKKRDAEDEKELSAQDVETLIGVLIKLLPSLQNGKDKVSHSATSAALEICAEISSKNRTDAAKYVRETLLKVNAICILVNQVFDAFSPGRNKIHGISSSVAKNRNSTSMLMSSTAIDVIHPGTRDHILNNAMRVLANCSFRNEQWQNRVREVKGIEAVLNCTSINEKNPILREWALLAVRNLCDGNLANQRRIELLRPKNVLQDPTLKKAGYQVRFDESTGKPKIEREIQEERNRAIEENKDA